jgi:hypothetical protein
MRELKAVLPNMLQLLDVQLDVRTLEVGDYILSPELCVERKSLPGKRVYCICVVCFRLVGMGIGV